MIQELITKDGAVAGRIEEIDGMRFIILTGNAPVFLNGAELNAKNRFGKIRPYIIEENDIIEW